MMKNQSFLLLFVFAIGVLTANPVFARHNPLLNYLPANYVQPKYDAFDHDYYRQPKLAIVVDTPPNADFNIFTSQTGFQNSATGTTETVFTFDASASNDAETPVNRLEIRWYFENEKTPDSYFSRIKNIKHTFKKEGIYKVKLEILDKGGNIASMVKIVTVVQNTSPVAHFMVAPEKGAPNTIFYFDTSKSQDDQYLAPYLEYRFDWNSDGKWDTAWQNKTNWYHSFEKIGKHQVRLEVRDPGGQKAVFSREIIIATNTLPTASFTVNSVPGAIGKSFKFDASASADTETMRGNLLYRWDFNYNGSNDIVYDTAWSYSNKQFWRFEKPRNYKVKLEVRDANEGETTAFGEVNTNSKSNRDQFQASAGI